MIHSNNREIVSLFQTNTMALYEMNKRPFRIGNFHLGFCQSEWIVWGDNFLNVLKAKEFDDAIKEAYKKITAHCSNLQIPPPPKPQ